MSPNPRPLEDAPDAPRDEPPVPPSSGAAVAGNTSAATTARRPAGVAASPRTFWVGVVSQQHVARGVDGGFVQLNHGRAGPLERMCHGDGLVYYSPRAEEGAGPALQAFTAIARIEGDAIVAADIDGYRFFRRAASYLPAVAAPIRPLIDHLTFIRSKTHWGAAFRFGFLRIPEHDFARIAAAMECDPACHFALDAAVATPSGAAATT